jgi:hypothetical protein
MTEHEVLLDKQANRLLRSVGVSNVHAADEKPEATLKYRAYRNSSRKELVKRECERFAWR